MDKFGRVKKANNIEKSVAQQSHKTLQFVNNNFTRVKDFVKLQNINKDIETRNDKLITNFNIIANKVPKIEKDLFIVNGVIKNIGKNLTRLLDGKVEEYKDLAKFEARQINDKFKDLSRKEEEWEFHNNQRKNDVLNLTQKIDNIEKSINENKDEISKLEADIYKFANDNDPLLNNTIEKLVKRQTDAMKIDLAEIIQAQIDSIKNDMSHGGVSVFNEDPTSGTSGSKRKKGSVLKRTASRVASSSDPYTPNEFDTNIVDHYTKNLEEEQRQQSIPFNQSKQ